MSNHRDDPDAIGPAGAQPLGGPEPGVSSLPRTTIEIALNCAGFFAGLLIMTGDYLIPGRSMEPKNWAFIRSPQAMVWIFLVAGEFAFWATIIEPLWRRRSRLRRDYHLRLTREIRIKSAAALIFFALPGYFLVRIVPDSDLWHHDGKMTIVNLIAMVVALVAVTGIWYVRAALEATFAGKGTGGRPMNPLPGGVRALLELRDDLQRFITLLGAMVALSTLTRGALRQAFLATQGKAAADFPPEYVLLQGAYFTGLLALVYIPTFTVLAAIGNELLESAYPIEPDLDWGNLSQWQANRKSLEELLQLRSGALASFGASLSILAPTATSVITVLLGSK